ncbi:MAG: hypothetical protein RIC38_17215 [Chromatocurvus sp.]
MLPSIVSYARYRYLWLALILVAASVALYFSQAADGAQPRNGGTWQGYTLGTVGALLIVWLSLLGVRKRSYRSAMGRVQGWTSAHVYLGLALLVIATLHCALQFGLNVHTLAYILMCLVVLSGIYGLYAYLALPGSMAANNAGRDIAASSRELEDIDRQISRAAVRGDGDLRAVVDSALELTRLGGSAWSVLAGGDRSRVRLGGSAVDNRDQGAVIAHLAARVPQASRRREAELLNELLDMFGRRQVLLRRLRRDARLRGLVQVWLFFHIPLTVALLFALVVHILSVFIYW